MWLCSAVSADSEEDTVMDEYIADIPYSMVNSVMHTIQTEY